MRRLLASMLLLTCSSVMAFESTFYHMFSKNTPSLPQTQILVDTMAPVSRIDFRQGQSCTVKSRFDQDRKPALIEIPTGRYWQSLQLQDGLCDIDLGPVRWLGMQIFYYDICVRHDSKINSMEDLIKHIGTKASFASGSHGGHWFMLFNKHYGTHVKSIEYPNSGAAALAVVSGDVEVAMISDLVASRQVALKNMRCLGTSQPGQSNSLSKLLPRIPTPVNEAPQIFALGVKNVSDGQYQSLIKAIQQGKQQLDSKFPDNRFQTVGASLTENSMNQQIKMSIFGLYEFTKNQ